MRLILVTAVTSVALAAGGTVQAAPEPAAAAVREVVVTASTENMIGRALTSSQGVVTKQELALRPVYRVGQLLETVPGLVVTAHSGEGKANQYLLRGFNLDHGTDIAVFVDGMPVNERTHAHGQGYSDLNFFVPELAKGINFTKGPYFAAEGDFGTVGAVHLDYLDRLPNQVSASAGTLGDDRLFASTTQALGRGRLLAAGELSRLNGPWDHPDNARKANAILRYSEGDADDGFAVTALYYRGLWNATTDQPERAMTEGLIGRYGTLDPSDGGQALRYSLSGRYARSGFGWRLRASAYVIHSKLTLWNDFTHVLDDPVNGDQHAQNDRRTTLGGAASFERDLVLLGADATLRAGLQGRYDDVYVDLAHTLQRAPLSTLKADKVREGSVGAYTEATVNWRPWLRTTVGARVDDFNGVDRDILGGASGSTSLALFQPKASLVLGPWSGTEVYFSAGRGFHSNDVRAVVLGSGSGGAATLLAKSTAEEVGVRTTIIPHVQLAATAFQIDFASELTYDADVGQTSAGRPSRRRGIEITGQYRPWPWIELNANFAFSHARYRDADPAGPYIPDAPVFIASAGMLIDNLGPWSAGVELRDLGPHPLIEDNSVRSNGDSEWNVNLGYKLAPSLKLRVDVFNILDSKDDAADYYYVSRLRGEPAAGVADLHIHPLEPRSARFTLTKIF